MLAARELHVYQQRAVLPERRTRRRPRPAPRRLSQAACVGLVLAIVVLAFGLAYRQNTLVRLGYRVDGLTSKLALLGRENDEREVRIASLGELGRVQQLAEERLGMVRPRSGVYVASGVLAPAPDSTVTAVAIAGGTHAVAPPPGSDLGAFGRLWQLLLRLTGNTAEAAGNEPK